MLSHVALASISLTRAFPCCTALVLAALSLSFTHFSWAARTTVIMAALLLCARLHRFLMLSLTFSVLLAHVDFSDVRRCSGASPATI